MRARLSLSTYVAIAFLLVVIALVAIVPVTPIYNPYQQNLAASLVYPFSRSFDGHFYLLGSDTLGRDMLSRLALAGQVSILIGLGAVVVSLVVGVALGLIAGFFRGWVEAIIMGVADLQLSVPRVLLLIAVTAIIGPSVFNLTLLLGITSWVAYGRVARAMALSLREREFVLSATAQGASATWNLRKHLLPHVLPQMLILGSYELGQIIVLESALSYLGLGVQPPLPSWGMMVSEGQSYLELNPWLVLLPSIALFLLVAGVQFVSQVFTSESDGSFEFSKPGV